MISTLTRLLLTILNKQSFFQVYYWLFDNLLFKLRPDGERRSEKNFVSFEQDQVPHPQDGFPRQAGGEDGEEPLHREDVRQRGFVAGATC